MLREPLATYHPTSKLSSWPPCPWDQCGSVGVGGSLASSGSVNSLSEYQHPRESGAFVERCYCCLAKSPQPGPVSSHNGHRLQQCPISRGLGSGIGATPGTVPCLTSVASLRAGADPRGLPQGLVRAKVMYPVRPRHPAAAQ